MTESNNKEEGIDIVTLEESGCNGSVILFVILLSSVRVALGFLMSVTG
jgi:hypothetical protein